MSTIIEVNPTEQTSTYSFNPDLLPDDEEGQQCRQDIYRLAELYVVLTERKRCSDIAAYTSQHEALVMEGRKLAHQQAELQEEQVWLNQQANEIDEMVQRALFNLQQVKKAVPTSMWTTNADRDAHNTRVEQAERTLATANAQQSKHNEAVAVWRERTLKLDEQVQNLHREVAQVWTALERAKGHKVANRKDGLPS